LSSRFGHFRRGSDEIFLPLLDNGGELVLHGATLAGPRKTGNSCPRGAGFPACGFWGLASPRAIRHVPSNTELESSVNPQIRMSALRERP
jgi:hypothetical protein